MQTCRFPINVTLGLTNDDRSKENYVKLCCLANWFAMGSFFCLQTTKAQGPTPDFAKKSEPT